MSNTTSQGRNQIFGDTHARAEKDLRHLVHYINVEIVSAVQRTGPNVLRQAAAEFHRIADRMEDAAVNRPSKDAAKL